MTRGILVLMFAFSLSAGAAQSPTAQLEVLADGSGIIRISAEQASHCVKNDGCILLTSREIAMIVQYMLEKSCRGEKASVRK